MSWWRRERIWAMAIVIVLHALAFHGLSLPTATTVDADAMEVVFVLSAPAAPARPVQAGASGPSAKSPRTTFADTTKVAKPVAQERGGSESPPTPPGQRRTAANHRALALSLAVEQAIGFERDPLAGARNPLAGSEPERFRMRPSASPREIVRSVSQLLGLWPPGYSDDPCGGIRKSVRMLTGAPGARAQARLLDALRAEERYCR